MNIREVRGATRFLQTQKRVGTETIEAICVGFDSSPGAAQFVFVRASDASRNLEAPDIIPCRVESSFEYPSNGGEILRGFKLEFSVHQRASGSYHLIAWCDAEEGKGGVYVNNAVVYEFGLTIVGLGSEELEAERQAAIAAEQEAEQEAEPDK